MRGKIRVEVGGWRERANAKDRAEAHRTHFKGQP